MVQPRLSREQPKDVHEEEYPCEDGSYVTAQAINYIIDMLQ